VRAINASGSSTASNAITLSFPGSRLCAALPEAATSVRASLDGTTVWLTWRPPASGPEAESYMVNVSGTFEGSFHTAAPGFGGTVAPGTYVVTVQSVNSCGVSAPSAPITISVP
jgi:hypothetical protein